MSGLTPIPPKQQDDLLNLGVYAMIVLGVNDKPMRTVITDALQSQVANTTFLSTIKKKMTDYGSDVDPLTALLGLQLFISSDPSVPGDQREYRLRQLRIGWGLQITSFCFVLLRLCVKHFVVGRVKRDDLAMFLAMYLSMSIVTNIVHANISGIYLSMISVAIFGLYIIELMYLATSWTVKAALMLFFWDLVPPETTLHFFHRSIRATFLALTLIVFSSAFLIIFQCRPVNFWDDLANAQCLPRQVVFTVSSALIVATDLVVLVLPIKVVWGLRLRRREKVVITGLFGLGAVACGTAVYRLVLFASMVDHTDITYNQCSVSIWSVIEGCIAIIAACIPALKALITKYFSRLSAHMAPPPTLKEIIDTVSTWTRTQSTTKTSSGPPSKPRDTIRLSVMAPTVVEVESDAEELGAAAASPGLASPGLASPGLASPGLASPVPAHLDAWSTEALRGSEEQLVGQESYNHRSSARRNAPS